MVVDETSSQTGETDRDTDDAASNQDPMLDSTKYSQPQAPPDVDFESGSKRHQRKRSLIRQCRFTRPRNKVFTDRLMRCPRRLKILKLHTLLIQWGTADYVQVEDGIKQRGQAERCLRLRSGIIAEEQDLSISAASTRSQENRLSMGLLAQRESSWRNRAIQGANCGQGFFAEVWCRL